MPLLTDTPETFTCQHPLIYTLMLTYFATLQEALVLVELDSVEGPSGLQELVLSSLESLSSPTKVKSPTLRMQMILKEILNKPDIIELKTEDIPRMVEYIPHLKSNLVQLEKDLNSIKL